MLIIDAWRRWPPPEIPESLSESARRGILEMREEFIGIERRLTRNLAIMLAWTVSMAVLIAKCP
jgi:hypothetical protein